MYRLHEEAAQRWRNRCPCCTRPFTKVVAKLGRPQPGTMRTRGHDRAVAHGGDPQQWLFVCRSCNEHQGWLSFAAFARLLLLRNDPRAELVAEVARFCHQWREKRRLAA